MEIKYPDTKTFFTLKEALLHARNIHINQAVDRCNGNITHAAKLLGLKSRTPIYRSLYPERYLPSVEQDL